MSENASPHDETPTLAPLPRFVVHDVVVRALAEDLGRGDLTTDACVPAGTVGEAELVARVPLVCAGLGVFRAVFAEVDPDVEIVFQADDGDRMPAGARVAVVRGAAGSILKSERVALNFVQRMSGVATKTRALVDALPRGGKTRIADTRKTTPGWRALEKYAVRCGGCANHRSSLGEHVLIKDNHIAAAGSLARAVKLSRAAAPHLAKIEVEAKTLAEVKEALRAQAGVILLDNMAPDMIRRAVALIAGAAVVEVSGGVRLDTVRDYALPGVDVISIGALTHSATAVDLSLDAVPSRKKRHG